MARLKINSEQREARIASLMRYAEAAGLMSEMKSLTADAVAPDTSLTIHMKRKELQPVKLLWSVVWKECLELDSQETPR
jgi:hypothetical protein